MSAAPGIPKVASIAINDFLDNCLKVESGQEIVLLAHVDGLYGGDNMVDEDAIGWISSGISSRGANPTVVWVDEPMKPHAWRVPPAAKAAIKASDALILNSLDLEIEEIVEMKDLAFVDHIPHIRNFATTGPLLCTPWARTPYKLVSQIRHEAGRAFVPGQPLEMWDDVGTQLTAVILPSDFPLFPTYDVWRHENGGYYRPWPEWVFPPVNLTQVNGTCAFDCMLSYWSRFIGISPYFNARIKLTIEDSRIVNIEGGEEADALKRFLEKMRERLGDGVYRFDHLHGGVHPQAMVSPQQCPNILHRRMIEHAHSCNIHVHVGAPDWTDSYYYWMHCTGDLRTASLRVGDKLVWDKGHLTVLDSPEVKAVAAEYPDRPGLEPEPRSW
jgi:hypothetical protein